MGWYACDVCGWKFTLDRIDTHQNICRRWQLSGNITEKKIGNSNLAPCMRMSTAQADWREEKWLEKKEYFGGKGVKVGDAP